MYDLEIRAARLIKQTQLLDSIDLDFILIYIVVILKDF
jgi:hypothetical protein